MAANLALYKNLKYDPLKDFVPVHGMLQSPTVLVVDASKPYKTLPEFIAYAKANPGKLTYASAGIGTYPHLDMLRLLRAARIVKSERQGKQVFYSAADAHISGVLNDMLEHIAEPSNGTEA